MRPGKPRPGILPGRRFPKGEASEHDADGQTLGLQLLLGEAEVFAVVIVNGIPQALIGALVQRAGASLGDAGNEVPQVSMAWTAAFSQSA